jgi:hypothetical protein
MLRLVAVLAIVSADALACHRCGHGQERIVGVTRAGQPVTIGDYRSDAREESWSLLWIGDREKPDCRIEITDTSDRGTVVSLEGPRRSACARWAGAKPRGRDAILAAALSDGLSVERQPIAAPEISLQIDDENYIFKLRSRVIIKLSVYDRTVPGWSVTASKLSGFDGIIVHISSLPQDPDGNCFCVHDAEYAIKL